MFRLKGLRVSWPSDNGTRFQVVVARLADQLVTSRSIAYVYKVRL